jgi:ATP-grasp domain
MNSTDHLSGFEFLSELYARDAPDTVLLTEYPSSNSTQTGFRNFDRYPIHDPFPPPEHTLMKILGPHHLMCGWGAKVPVCSEIKPPQILFDHWRRVFGENGVPHWQAYVDAPCYTTIFPHQSIPAAQQEIAPDILHDLHSKEAIGEIDCPQAAILASMAPPCVVKLSHGYAGLGNFFIRSEADASNAKAYIARHWPKARIVINALLEDIVGDYGVQFYLDRAGNAHWLGFTHQIFDAEQIWSGGTFSQVEQDSMRPEFEPFIAPTAAYLHANGYYGLVGIDILQTKAGQMFLVDLNPRLTGITPFLVMSRLFAKEDFEHGIYVPSLTFEGPIEALINQVEKMKNTKAVVLSAAQNKQNNTTTCHVSVSAKTLEHCQQGIQQIRTGTS